MNNSQLLKTAEKFYKLVTAHVDFKVPRSFQHSFQQEFFHGESDTIFKNDYEKWLKKNANILMPLFAKQGWWEFRNGNLLSLDDNYTIISKTSKPQQVMDQDFHVSSSTILQSEGVIPTLWLYHGSITRTSPIIDKDPILGHYYFIIQALSSLFERSTEDEEFIYLAEEFIQKYKNKIDQIKNLSHGGEIARLGTGAQGIAFQLNPNLVVKFFTSVEAYQEAKVTIERLHKHPDLARTEAMIYDFGTVGLFRKSPVYYYIMEKMKPVRNFNSSVGEDVFYLIKEIVTSILENKEYWRPIKRKIYDPKYHKKIKKIVLDKADDLAFIFQNEELAHDSIKKVEQKIPGLNQKWLSSLIEEVIMKYLTDRSDLHTGNLGVTNYGEFRYFDPAHPAYTSNINI